MKDIRLMSLGLNNFQGGNFILQADGEDVDVFGANGTGKTRLASAFSWLLFGKDSLGRADFEIKNLDGEGTAAHGLEHGVEGILNIDGTTITLKRVYHEVWTKKRGTAQKELTGNTTDYYVDGVPAKESEYKTRVAEIFGDEITCKLLTSPTAFPALDWKKQRSLLLEVCGDITDAQVIETDPALAPLTDLLKKYTVSKTPLDDLRKVIMSGRTEINRKLDQLPVRIDETSRSLPDVTGMDRKGIATDVTRLESLVNEAKLRLSGIDNGGTIADLSKRLAGVDADISKIERDHYNATMQTVTRLNSQVNEIKDGIKAQERKRQNIKDDIASKQRLLTAAEERLVKLREEWTQVDAEAFQDTTADTCPSCGQSLPTERVEDARDKAKAAFNRSKAQRLTDIETRGRALAADVQRYKDVIISLQASMPPGAESRDEEIKQLTIERDAVKNLAENYEDAPGYLDLMAQKSDLEAEIKTARECVQGDKSKIEEEIKALEAQYREIKEKAYRFTRREEGERRIEELKAEEKKLSRQFEGLEQQLFLIESLTKRKADLMNERINGRFNLVRFKLFNQLVNGGSEDCCEITVGGVPFGGGLNSAARTQAGLEIVAVLQDHYGIAPVVWIDNRESCTDIPEMKCQVVSLYVAPEDKTLRVEKARKERMATAWPSPFALISSKHQRMERD